MTGLLAEAEKERGGGENEEINEKENKAETLARWKTLSS